MILDCDEVIDFLLHRVEMKLQCLISLLTGEVRNSVSGGVSCSAGDCSLGV